jgi:hypothetical protein
MSSLSNSVDAFDLDLKVSQNFDALTTSDTFELPWNTLEHRGIEPAPIHYYHPRLFLTSAFMTYMSA